jgi:hypothetical protein
VEQRLGSQARRGVERKEKVEAMLLAVKAVGAETNICWGTNMQ